MSNLYDFLFLFENCNLKYIWRRNYLENEGKI